jgi:CYTH domain-containing protein
MIEIERKWRLPAATAVLGLSGREREIWQIEQIYLCERDEWSERVRRVTLTDGAERFFYTRKLRLSALAREEEEREIDKEEFARLREAADPQFEPLLKTRMIFSHAERRWELDLFERFPGNALLELELDSEDEPASSPGFLGPAVEVSGDSRYSSRALARKGAEFPR